MSFTDNWSYTNNIKWSKNYPLAKGNNQSPINITKDKLIFCDILCDISMSFSNSNCILTIKNNTPIIYFNSKTYILKKINKQIFRLKMMTLHSPSLHSIDGVKYDMEAVLYFKKNGSVDPKSQNYVPGGMAMSFLFEKGDSFGEHNNFFNSFIYQIPTDTNNMDGNIDIDVGDNWGVNMLMPKNTAYYFYEGSLPFPPCEEDWTWFVMEDIQQINPHILSVFNMGFNNNIRSLNNLNKRKVSINNKIEIIESKKKIKQIEEKALKTYKQTISDNNNTNNTNNIRYINTKNEKIRKIIKIVIFILAILLIIFASLKITKYILKNNIVNKLFAPSLINKTSSSTIKSSSGTTSSSSGTTSSSSGTTSST